MSRLAAITDTSPEALRVLIDCYRRMPLERKWRILGDSYRFARILHASGMRLRKSSATEDDIRRDWAATHSEKASLEANGSTSPMHSQPVEHQEVIRSVLDAFEKSQIKVAIGGSIASSLFGVPRYTHDADLTAEDFSGREGPFVQLFDADYYVSLAAVREANQRNGSFNIIHLPSGFKVDVFILKSRAFDQNLLQRRIITTELDPSGRPIAVLSPEDILLHKLEWFRLGGEVSDRQWEDVLGVLRVQGERLDGNYLDQWAKELGVSDLLTEARADAAI